MMRLVDVSVSSPADFRCGHRFYELCSVKVSQQTTMSKFEAVNVVKAANIYFDGKVTSRTVEFPGGEIKTLGVMLPGEYKFNTGKPELMEIQSGHLTYCLADESTWHEIHGGQSFHVPGNSYFLLKVTQVADYICSFL